MTLILGILLGTLFGYIIAAFFINSGKYDFTKYTKCELRQIIIDIQDEIQRRKEDKPII